MADLSRRAWMQALAAAPALLVGACRKNEERAPAVPASHPNNIRIAEVQHAFESYTYRTPYQFGGRSVDRVTLLNVRCRVRTGNGREAWGFGSMSLGNAWSFPAASQDAGLGAMKALADELRRVTADCDDTGLPWFATSDLVVLLSKSGSSSSGIPSRSASFGGVPPATITVAALKPSIVHDNQWSPSLA